MNMTSWRRRLLGAAAALTLAATSLGTAPAGARAGEAVPAIDNSNRTQVAATYRSAIEANALLNPNWTGTTNGCVAGTASNEYDAATVESINWFRSMAGLQPVVENAEQSKGAQQAALMMQAQNALSHYPSTAWPCYTAAGANSAAVSNLTLNLTGTRSVMGQIEDPGAGNEALGHRRWLLFPGLTSIGVANTSRASTVQVINNFGARNHETDWVSWPPAGFVPDDTIFPRWSTSYAGAGSVDFSNARVTVTENGVPLPVTLLPISVGFGDPALGWEVAGANPTAPGDVIYRVSIANVIVNGQNTSRSYSVTSFDAASSAPLGPFCNGRQATIIGTDGADVLKGTPGNDVIVGLGGDDVIDGFAGHDIICGGPGADIIRAGWGNDFAFGGNGQDFLRGANGEDILRGGNGRDRLDGGAGADTLVGGDHYDTLLGAGGNDTCWGRTVSQSTASADNRFCEAGR